MISLVLDASLPKDDFTLWIEFERGDKILFNMQRLIKTLPFVALNNGVVIKGTDASRTLFVLQQTPYFHVLIRVAGMEKFGLIAIIYSCNISINYTCKHRTEGAPSSAKNTQNIRCGMGGHEDLLVEISSVYCKRDS